MRKCGIFAGHQTQLREQVKQIGLQILNKPIKVGKQKKLGKNAWAAKLFRL